MQLSRPLTFFGGAGLAAVVARFLPGMLVTWEFLRTGQARIPSAVLAVGLVIARLSLILMGVVLTTLAGTSTATWEQ